VDRPVALVTGGARRVGRAICVALARAGCSVRFTYLASEGEARSLERDLAAMAPGAPHAAARLDLDDSSAVEDFARAFASREPRLDVLVHNASKYQPSPLDSLTREQAQRLFRVNALAPLILSRGLAPMLARSERPGGGAIACLCDIHASDRPRRNHAAYAMSKAALEQMVRSLALDLAPRVRVNGVAPGVVAFPESGPESDPEMQTRYLSRVPMGRSGAPEEAAEAVRWLALDATYTTGLIVRVDGGRWIG
jgi:pteridine reductase